MTKKSKEQDLKTVTDTVNAAAPVQETVSEAVSRLSTLSPLEYEKVRKAEAEKLGIDRVSVLDKEVENSRKPVQTQNDATGIFSSTEPHHEAVNGSALLNEIAEIIRRFIVCDPETITATSLWIVFTWLISTKCMNAPNPYTNTLILKVRLKRWKNVL